MYWINLAQDGAQWGAVVKTVAKKLSVFIKGCFQMNWATLSFTERTELRAVGLFIIAFCFIHALPNLTFLY